MSRLFYVIGPSGAGKDSILNAARERLAERRCCFAHRYITRPADAGGENHVALSAREFAVRKQAGLFCLDWESHGNCYGLGIELRQWLEAGLDVVMNGSRGYLPEAARRFPEALHPVSIVVDPGILRARLEQRGRETAAEIDQRVAQAQAFEVAHPRLVEIRNDGDLADAVDAFCALITCLGMGPGLKSLNRRLRLCCHYQKPETTNSRSAAVPPASRSRRARRDSLCDRKKRLEKHPAHVGIQRPPGLPSGEASSGTKPVEHYCPHFLSHSLPTNLQKNLFVICAGRRS